MRYFFYGNYWSLDTMIAGRRSLPVLKQLNYNNREYHQSQHRSKRSLIYIVLSCVVVLWSALYGDQERMRSVFECICVWTPRCVVLYDSAWYWQVFYSYASLLLLASLWLLVVVFLFGVYQGVRRHALCCLYAADVLLTFFKLYVPPGYLICTIFIFKCVCYLWFHSFVLGGGLHCNGVLVGHTSIMLRSFEWVIRLFSWSDGDNSGWHPVISWKSF